MSAKELFYVHQGSNTQPIDPKVIVQLIQPTHVS